VRVKIIRILVAACATLALASASWAAQPPRKPEFRVLIVGVDHYRRRDPSFDDLNGTGDAWVFRHIVEVNWGDMHPRFNMVLDPHARREDIMKAFTEWFVKGAGPRDTLLFYFSGHGTTVPADKITKIRSALVPQDVVNTLDGLDERSLLTGTFFRTQLAQLRSQGVRNVTLILDACQSAGLRGPQGIPKGIMNTARDAATTPGSGGPLFNPDDPTGDYVVISASASNEWAWQGPYGGDLTVAIKRAIQSYRTEHAKLPNLMHERPMTYGDLRDRILGEMEGLAVGEEVQHPYVRGNLSRTLFSFGAISAEPYFPVTVQHRAGKSQEVHVHCGTLLGVSRDSEFDVYPPGTPKFTGIRPVARGRVIAATPFDSLVAIVRRRTSLDHLNAGRARWRQKPEETFRHLSGLEAANPGLRVEMQAFPVTVVDKRVVEIGKDPLVGPDIDPGQAYTLAIRALGPTGKPLKSTSQFLYTALLDCMPDGALSVLWPKAQTASDETKLFPDGIWRYLGRNGRFTDRKFPDSVEAWRIGRNQGSGLEFIKLIGTDQTEDYSPIVAKQVGCPAKASVVRSSVQPRTPHQSPDAPSSSRLRTPFSVATFTLRKKL